MASATLRHAAWILRGNPLTGIAAAGVFLLILIGTQLAPDAHFYKRWEDLR